MNESSSALSHSRLCRNISFELESLFRPLGLRCETLLGSSQFPVCSEQEIVPDICIVSGDAEFNAKKILSNPYAIIEVVTPTTFHDDHISKFRAYQKAESLRHYILTEQSRPYVIHYEKLPTGIWAIVGWHTDLQEALKISLGSVEIVIPLSRLYYRVEFSTPTIE